MVKEEGELESSESGDSKSVGSVIEVKSSPEDSADSQTEQFQTGYKGTYRESSNRGRLLRFFTIYFLFRMKRNSYLYHSYFSSLSRCSKTVPAVPAHDSAGDERERA